MHPARICLEMVLGAPDCIGLGVDLEECPEASGRTSGSVRKLGLRPCPKEQNLFIWEHFWADLGALLAHLGALGGTLGSLGGHLGSVWRHLVVLWGDLGTTWRQFGTLGKLMSVLSYAIWGRCAPHSSPKHFLDGFRKGH